MTLSKRMHRIGGIACIVLVLFTASWLLLYKLGAEPLQDYDEATYAEVATENIASANHLSFTFLGTDYFRKPPLLFWLMDASQSISSISIPSLSQEAGARFPSAFSGIVLVGVVMLLVFAATDSLYIAALAGAILTTTGAYIEPARQARFDILVSFFIMAAVYAFMRGAGAAGESEERAKTEAKRRGRDGYWYVIFGAMLGLALMTKGPLAVYAVVAVLGVSVVYGWRFIGDRFRDPYMWGGVAAFFVVVLPWHLYESARFGYAFWEEYLGDQVLNRVGQLLFNGPTNSEYLGYLFGFAAPWALVFCVALVVLPFVWKRMQWKALALSTASIAGVAIVLLVCFLSKTKAISYLIPLYPFMAVFIALIAAELYPLASRTIYPLVAKNVLSGVLGLLLVFGLGIAIWDGFHINPYYTQEVQLATDEKNIGEILLAAHSSGASNFYEYDTLTLGSIMFYSGFLTPGTYNPANPPAAGSYVLYQTDESSQLYTSTSTGSLIPAYKGQWLSLARTTDR